MGKHSSKKSAILLLLIPVIFTQKINARYLVSCHTRDGKIKTWDTEKDSDQTPITFNHSYVDLIAFNPQKRNMLVSCSTRDGIIRIWNTKKDSNQIPIIFNHEGQFVSSIAFNFQKPNILASCSYRDGTIKIWDTEKGSNQIPKTFSHGGSVSSIAFNPEKPNILASCSYRDGKIKIWDTEKDPNQIPKTFNYRCVKSIAFQPSKPILEQEIRWEQEEERIRYLQKKLKGEEKPGVEVRSEDKPPLKIPKFPLLSGQ